MFTDFTIRALDLVPVHISVQVVVDTVQSRRVVAINLEPPIADTGRLAENCAVWTEEAELTPVWQTPMPDLTSSFRIGIVTR